MSNIPPIDFTSMSDNQFVALSNATKIVATYLSEKKGIDLSIRETLDSLAEEMKFDKKEKAYMNKILKKAARVYVSNKEDELSEETIAIETLLSKINSKSVQQHEDE
jgi:hypothetical protein